MGQSLEWPITIKQPSFLHFKIMLFNYPNGVLSSNFRLDFSFHPVSTHSSNQQIEDKRIVILGIDKFTLYLSNRKPKFYFYLFDFLSLSLSLSISLSLSLSISLSLSLSLLTLCYQKEQEKIKTQVLDFFDIEACSGGEIKRKMMIGANLASLNLGLASKWGS